MKRLIVAAVMLAGMAFGFLKSYDVMPVKASWSAVTDTSPFSNWVGQTFTANFDSVAEAWLFVGDVPDTSHHFWADIYDEDNNRVAYNYDAPASQGQAWLRFPLTTLPGRKFIRGRQYLVKFTRPGDSIQFYYADWSPYDYGEIVVPQMDQPEPVPVTADLCMKLFGKARADGFFSTMSVIAMAAADAGDTTPGDRDNWEYCIEREADLGVEHDKLGYAYWRFIQPHGPADWRWGWMDSLIACYARNHIDPTISLGGGARWNVCTNLSPPKGIVRNLHEPVLLPGGGVNDSNYLAKLLWEAVRRYGPRGHFWSAHPELPYQPVMLIECPGEPQQGALGRADWNGYWFRDNLIDSAYRAVYDRWDIGYTEHDARRFSFREVFSRYIIVQDSAVKLAAASLGVPQESMPRTSAYVIRPREEGDHTKFTPIEWLDGYRMHGADSFFDVGSYFSYEGMPYAKRIEEQLDSLRAAFDAAHLRPRPFWATEGCIPAISPTQDGLEHEDTVRASRLLQTLASIPYINSLHGQPLEQFAWYTFTRRYMRDDTMWHTPATERYWARYGITDSASGPDGFQPGPSGYAYKQWATKCRGATYEGRLAPYTRPWDTTYGVQVLQFADSANRRFWVGWNLTWEWPESLRVPARSNVADTVRTALSATPPSGPWEAGADGWVALPLDSVPVIVCERADTTRPDLAVDSVRLRPAVPVCGRPETLLVYVRNHGNRGTPGYAAPDSTDQQHPTWVYFYRNDTLFDSLRSNVSIPPGATRPYRLVIPSVPQSMQGLSLFAAKVNQRQVYVEMGGWEDNDGYVRTVVRRPPEGDIEIVSQDGRHNLPIVPVRLHTADYEQDSTGNTPCADARLLFSVFAKNDSLVAAETTAWFSGSITDTVVRFSLGEGRYHILLQVRDSAGTVSDTIGDTLHPVIIFDTTSATGTLELNFGQRFINVQQCTLTLTAADSLSGVALMRLGNQSPVNLIENGGFDSDAGWEFDGSGTYDNGLNMAVLPAKPDSAASIWQLIPKDSLSCSLGDSFRLSADLLVLPDSSIEASLGRLGFENGYTKAAPPSDTVWQEVAATEFCDTLAACAGHSPLSVAFVLPEPVAPESGRVWACARVAVRIEPQEGQGGTVWLDNVRLEQVGPEPDYADWKPYQEEGVWDLGSGAGEKTVFALLCDSCGNESDVALSGTVVYDPTSPVAAIVEPEMGSYVNKTVYLTGFAYDPVEVAGDTWFESYRLYYQHVDSAEWSPVLPDSIGLVPVYGDTAEPLSLGKWDTDGLEDGAYYLFLVATDSAWNDTTYKTWVEVWNWTEEKQSGRGPAGGEVGLNSGGDFVGSATGRIIQLDEELDSLSGFVFTDSGQNAYVAGITELDSGHLLCTDLRTGDVTKMTKQGTDKQELVQNLDLPVAVATDRSGNIWTLDKGESKLYKHRQDGSLVLTIGGSGTDSTQLNYPEAFTIRDSLVYIADTRNDRIAVCDTLGTLIELMAGEFQEPCAVAVTEDNRLYLVDKTAGTIEGINSAGGHLLTIAAQDSAPLRQLALTEDQLSLVTLKPGTNDILQYEVKSEDSLPGGIQTGSTTKLPQTFVFNQPHPNPMRASLTISYAIPSRQRVAVTIYDIAGKKTATVTDQDHRPGYYNQVWNRTDSHGRTAASGIYFVEVRTKTQSDRKKVVLTR